MVVSLEIRLAKVQAILALHFSLCFKSVINNNRIGHFGDLNQGIT